MKPFNVRNFPVVLVQLSVDALRFLNERSPQKEEEEKSVFDRLARELGSLIEPKAETCTLTLDLQEADLLQAALQVYLEDGDLRPGSEKHRKGTALYHGLCDYIATQMEKEFPKFLEAMVGTRSAIKKLADTSEGKKTDQEFQELVARKRDEIFGEIVGKPGETTMFGLSKVPHQELPTKPRFQENQKVKRRGPSPDEVNAMVRKTAYDPKPIADKAVDDDLTGGQPVDFDMRNERRRQAKTHNFFGR